MEVKSFIADSVSEIAEQVALHTSPTFQPSLAIVFCSIRFDLEAVSAMFDNLGIDVVGASTAGEIVNDEVYDGVITGFLFNLDQGSYCTKLQHYSEDGPFEGSKAMGIHVGSCFANPSLIAMSGGVSVDAEQIVLGVKEGIGREVPFFGGLAADDLNIAETAVFTREGVSRNGLAAVIFDNAKIELKGLATSGWEGIGMENTITHAEGNVVYAINNEPAIEAFIKYFGYFDNGEGKVDMSEISAQYPLQIIREDGTAILRAPLMGDRESGTLVLAAGVRNGDKFRFSVAPGFEVIDQTVGEFGEWQQSAPNADALILFSCKGRHAALGPLIEEEVKGIYNFWKKPMVGFFTYGEIGPSKNGCCEFHNETCSLVVISERK